MTDYDTIVVGGGIVGLAAARWLGRDREVLLLERDTIAGGATGKASGLVTIAADYEHRPEAARYAVDFFRSYEGTDHFSYTERPFHQLRSGTEPDALADRAAAFADRGFDVEYLSPDGLDDRYPGLFDLSEHTGAIAYAESGWLDPYTYATSFQADAEAEGVDIETGREVTSILAHDGDVTGVRADGETYDADTVVVAAGWRTRRLVEGYVSLPIRPFRYQTVNLQPGGQLPDDCPMAWDDRSRLYWRPEHNGELHVGGGTYFVDTPGDRRSNTTEGFRRLVAETIPDLVSPTAGARFVGGDTCPTGDSATPDSYPIIDAPTGAPAGLVVATGFHGFGIMASPVAGAAVRALAADEAAPFPLEGFALHRFEDRSTDFGYSYIHESPATIGPE